jgi:hypothetical protein
MSDKSKRSIIWWSGLLAMALAGYFVAVAKGAWWGWFPPIIAVFVVVLIMRWLGQSPRGKPAPK